MNSYVQVSYLELALELVNELGMLLPLGLQDLITHGILE